MSKKQKRTQQSTSVLVQSQRSTTQRKLVVGLVDVQAASNSFP